MATPLPHNLASLRTRLEHALLALADQDDDDAVLLRGDLRGILAILTLMLDAPRTVTPERTTEILARGLNVIEHVRDYADRAGVYLPSGTLSDTLVMDSAAILRAIASLRAGATEPPAELLPAIVEAAEGPSPHGRDTVPVPADAATRTDLQSIKPSPAPPSFATFAEDDDDAEQ